MILSSVNVMFLFPAMLSEDELCGEIMLFLEFLWTFVEVNLKPALNKQAE